MLVYPIACNNSVDARFSYLNKAKLLLVLLTSRGHCNGIYLLIYPLPHNGKEEALGIFEFIEKKLSIPDRKKMAKKICEGEALGIISQGCNFLL